MRITEKYNVDNFLKTRFISGAFLQSSVWQEFLKKQNKKYWQISVKDENNIIASCLIYENKLPFGKSYLYSPKGPIISSDISNYKKEKAFHLLLSKIRDLTVDTKKEEEIFLSLEVINIDLTKEFIKTNNIQPADTLIIDLTKDIENILKKMHQKTRYNIGLANRKGVKIEVSKKEKDIEIFLKLIKKTAKKNNIKIHPDKYYRLLWKTLLEKKSGELYLAKINNIIIAANIIIKFGQSVTYLHGGFDYNYRTYMAPYLLQWEIIKKIKKEGFLFYDFWGIASKNNKNNKWSGFTRFKKGFGGQEKSSLGTYNFIYNKQIYFLYSIFKKIKNMIKI
tara:strand:+ start:959 stop:1966 length:1008 start_codon:yes stop_codon:yes gene_type:complete